MNTGLGIVLLVVFAIGAASILLWVAKQAVSAYRRFAARQPMTAATKKQRFVRVGHGNVLTNLNDLPQYKGETGLFGLPRYRDVIVPNKHNYATVVYMDHPVKQYVYDVMATCKGVCTGFKEEGKYKTTLTLLFFPAMFALGGVSIVNIVIVMAVILAVLYLWYIPSGMPMTRRMAENAKSFTPDTWSEIYKDVAESKEREDELVRALRRSGVRRL